MERNMKNVTEWTAAYWDSQFLKNYISSLEVNVFIKQQATDRCLIFLMLMSPVNAIFSKLYGLFISRKNPLKKLETYIQVILEKPTEFVVDKNAFWSWNLLFRYAHTLLPGFPSRIFNWHEYSFALSVSLYWKPYLRRGGEGRDK